MKKNRQYNGEGRIRGSVLLIIVCLFVLMTSGIVLSVLLHCIVCPAPLYCLSFSIVSSVLGMIVSSLIHRTLIHCIYLGNKTNCCTYHKLIIRTSVDEQVLFVKRLISSCYMSHLFIIYSLSLKH
jgi:hypothetical protein